MAGQVIHVALPDFTKLRISIDGESSIAELLRELLSLHKVALQNKSGLQRLKYSEWRLTFLPQSLSGKIWIRQDLMLLHKPLVGNMRLSQIATKDAENLLLFNVLETTPVRLSNLPNAPQTSIVIPTLRTTPLHELQSYIAHTLAVPETDKYDDSINYVTEFLPAGVDHESILTVESIKFSSNMINPSWLASTVSRPASYVSSWLLPAPAKTDNRPSDIDKHLISAPIASSTIADVTKSNHLTQYFMPNKSGHSQSADQTLPHIDSELEALLDDLCVPITKRDTIYSLPYDKRSSLISLQTGTSITETHHWKQDPPDSKESHELHSQDRITRSTTLDHRNNAHVEASPNFIIPILSPKLHAKTFKQESSGFEPAPASAHGDLRGTTGVPSTTRFRTHSRSRSKSPVRLNMSTCPPKLEWNKPKSPIRANNTGSSWLSSWWPKKDDSMAASSPESYVFCMRSASGTELLRDLTDMRIHVSTARMSWIATFLDIGGLDVLIQAANQQESILTELQTSITLETLKTFRILLNSRVGFEYTLSHSSVIMYIVAVCRLKHVQTSAMGFDLLAGICAASPDVGHYRIFCALSNLAISVHTSRFEWLSSLLRSSLKTTSASTIACNGNDQLRALLTLCNALITAWQNVEDRIALRYELFGTFLHKGLTDAKNFTENIQIQLNLLKNCMSDDQFELSAKLSTSSQSCHELARSSRQPPTSSTGDSCTSAALDSCQHDDQKLKRSGYTDDDAELPECIDQSDSSHLVGKGSENENQALSLQVNEPACMIRPSGLQSDSPMRCVTGKDHEHHGMTDDAWFTGDHNFCRTDNIVSSSTTDLASLEEHTESLLASAVQETNEKKENHCSLDGATKSALEVQSLLTNTIVSVSASQKPSHETLKLVSLQREINPQSNPPVSRKENQGIEKIARSSSVNPQYGLFSYRSLSNVSEASTQAEHNDNTGHDPDDARTVTNNVCTENVSPGEDQPIRRALLSPSASPVPDTQAHDDSTGTILPSVPPPPPPPPPPAPSNSRSVVGSMSKLVGRNGLRQTPSSISLLANARAPCSKRNLKPLFWDKLDSDRLRTSVWSTVSKRIDNGLLQELMLSDLEKYFVKDGCRIQKYGPSPFEKTRLSNKKGLIDAQKAKNIEVMLARTKRPYTEIAEGLMLMDADRVGTLDQLRIMEKNIPSAEDISLVQEYEGDLTLLGNAPKYILAIRSVPFLQDRLKALIYARTFDIDITEVSPELLLVTEACKEILQSSSLQDFLALALSAGNILNASTFRGQAQGFKLEGLIKLGEVRSTASERSGTSLLHYLVSVLQKQYGDNFDLDKQLVHCAAAARVSSQTMLDNVSSLVSGLQVIETSLREVDLRNQSTNDGFIRTMTEFIDHATPILQDVRLRAQSLEVLICEVLEYVGESASEMKIEDLFSTMHAVIELVARASEDNRTLRGNHIIRSKTSQCGLVNSSDFDGTLRAMRAGRHGREVSRELRDRPSSRVFPPPFSL